jgi:hypothetical protein
VYPCADSDALSLPDVNLKEGERGADVDTANLRTLGVGNLASEVCAAGLGNDIGRVVGVVGVGYAAENDAPSGGGGNAFVGAGLPGGMLRAERYLRSSSSDAYDLRSAAVGVLAERGGSESENELPPKVMAEVGVGVRDLVTVFGE